MICCDLLRHLYIYFTFLLLLLCLSPSPFISGACPSNFLAWIRRLVRFLCLLLSYHVPLQRSCYTSSVSLVIQHAYFSMVFRISCDLCKLLFSEWEMFISGNLKERMLYLREIFFIHSIVLSYHTEYLSSIKLCWCKKKENSADVRIILTHLKMYF